jgi:3-methylcrotonyl-CoA carboxylase alpha subunit
MGENQDPAFLGQQAAEIGYPVLIKAVAGGGGKGMRKVEDAADFADALASCQREATASFGNAHVLIEKYIQRPRHIEVQVFGDTHGNIVHLFERDCSLQRRHQKVIEEAPAPGMDEATREQLCAAAVKAAKAVDYVGAGTIEFIADASEGLRADRIWFMEMNTRLQVEHPVTEEITGVDLVEWQLRVASGEALPKRQDELSINGWAMEARLYAEDPEKGFLPSVGKIELMILDPFGLHYEDYESENIRIDTGVKPKDYVHPYYDPMIAKVISHGADRDHAISELSHSLAHTLVWPVKTNAAFIVKALDHYAFREGDISTGFIEQYAEELQPPSDPHPDLLKMAARKLRDERSIDEANLPNRYPSLWEIPFGYRLNAPTNRNFVLSAQGKRYEVELPLVPEPKDYDFAQEFLHNSEGLFTVEEGKTWRFGPYRAEGGGIGSASDGTILSPMPGRIIAVEVAAGQSVTKGQKLVTLEAMKMEHSLTAPFDGVVTELNADVGGQVREGMILVRVEEAI